MKKETIKEIVDTVVFVVIALIIIRFFICEVRWIPSASMKPTLVEGDRVFVERFSRFYSKRSYACIYNVLKRNGLLEEQEV